MDKIKLTILAALLIMVAAPLAGCTGGDSDEPTTEVLTPENQEGQPKPQTDAQGGEPGGGDSVQTGDH